MLSILLAVQAKNFQKLMGSRFCITDLTFGALRNKIYKTRFLDHNY